MIEWLLDLMDRQGISRNEMAEMIGMTHEEFADCADGKEAFTVPDMERMCGFLGVAWHLFHHPERAVDINDWRRRHGKKAK